MGGPIPYKPEALAMKKKYAANALREDAEIKCYLPGVPRMMYMPYPVQIVQSDRVHPDDVGVCDARSAPST